MSKSQAEYLTKGFFCSIIYEEKYSEVRYTEQKLFTKNDNSFICKNCGLEVQPLGSNTTVLKIRKNF